MFARKDGNDSGPMDLSKFIWQQKTEIAKALVPEPEDKHQRIDFITLLGGRRPNLNLTFLAHVEEEGWIDLEHLKEPDLEKVRAVKFLTLYAPSLDGKRSDQLVELGKSENHDELQSAMEWLKGRFKK